MTVYEIRVITSFLTAPIHQFKVWCHYFGNTTMNRQCKLSFHGMLSGSLIGKLKRYLRNPSASNQASWLKTSFFLIGMSSKWTATTAEGVSRLCFPPTTQSRCRLTIMPYDVSMPRDVMIHPLIRRQNVRLWRHVISFRIFTSHWHVTSPCNMNRSRDVARSTDLAILCDATVM